MHGTKPCFSFGKLTLGPHAPPWGDSGGPKYSTNRNTNRGYPGSAVSEFSSALPEVTSDASELSSVAS